MIIMFPWVKQNGCFCCKVYKVYLYLQSELFVYIHLWHFSHHYTLDGIYYYSPLQMGKLKFREFKDLS